MDSHRKYALQSKLSSHDQNSIAGDLGYPPQGVPVAEMLQSFKDQLENLEQEEEQAKKGHSAYQSE